METILKYAFNIILSILLFFIAYSGLNAIFATQTSYPCVYGQPMGMMNSLFRIPCMQPLDSQGGISSQLYPNGGYNTSYGQAGTMFTPETNIILGLMGASVIYILISLLTFYKFSYIWSGFGLASVYTYASGLMLSMQSGNYLLQFIASVLGLILVGVLGYIFLYKGNVSKHHFLHMTPQLNMDKELHFSINLRILTIIVATIVALLFIYWLVSAVLNRPYYTYPMGAPAPTQAPLFEQSL